MPPWTGDALWLHIGDPVLVIADVELVKPLKPAEAKAVRDGVKIALTASLDWQKEQ